MIPDSHLKELIRIAEHVANVFQGPKAPIGEAARAVLQAIKTNQ